MAKRIVVFSPKGGVGKTLIASNLAIAMAKEQKKKVCLIDFDLQVAGDMARILNLNPGRSIADLAGALTKQTPAAVKKEDFLIRSNWGVDFLAGVLKPQQALALDPAGIESLFDLIDQDYDYIVVDAGKSLSEIFLAILNQANLVLAVVTPDILSIYQTKWALDTLQFLHFPLAMVKVILNRSESLSSIGWQEIKVNLPAEIISRLPSDGKSVGQAINLSIPLIIDSPRSRPSVSIKALAGELDKNPGLFMQRSQIDELRLKEINIERSGAFWQRQGQASEDSAGEEVDGISRLKQRIHNRLIEELNLKRLDIKAFSDAKKKNELREKTEILIVNLLAEESGSLISSQEARANLVKEIVDEALGLGPLEDLLADPEITDIMVNNKDEVYIERSGRIELTSKKFISNSQVKAIIERIIAPIGRRIDESVPMVDARLSDGSRVNAIIPPLSLTGPALTIRKFRKERFMAEDLIKLNAFNSAMIGFIEACVVSRKNIIVSGGTGSGKTTVLNVLSSFIPDSERIITIEDAAELKLDQEHWIRLESRPPNIEGKGAITIRDIFRNTLRMRPDRIIIGECRGVETLDMLQAMNTGHDGSMTTIHANSTQDVLARLDSMILMSGVDLPLRSIREMIAASVDIIIHTARLSDGTRKIMQITEIRGMKDETHIGLEDIFLFKQTGIDDKGGLAGVFQATGYTPSFIEDIKLRGIGLPDNIFKK